ncbi:AtpZ/AtpI family protein [Nocardioides massiliensis]|uniref:F0F1-type ATP synthase assembly protein I n=1 Tax=Nocardioides massiliensis TaxID=1325935 RepID=A0ABT9NTT9_9ACTN|nr:AtpZ/AtpI family protein [Nocardioides massiliensis]MDP9823841.1 F0F1-type ATP synthase assembly protein I [Nocardioides massiliensis]
MTSRPDSGGPASPPSPDPWQAFSYLVSGVLVYGLLGWLADRWLGTSYLVAIGIVVGAGFGVYMVVKRFGVQDAPPGSRPQDGPSTKQ